jgi:GT2 family glycosyltransferase
MKTCDIIIPIWNELASTRECITKLTGYTHAPYRLIAVDNGSDEPTRAYVEGLKGSLPSLRVIRNTTNAGFVRAANQGIAASESPYLCILNNDAYVTDGWLTSLVETVEACPENAGIANPASNVFGKETPDGERHEWQELDSCKGFCMLIKREVVQRIGLFDEVFGMGYFEEKDFCRRAVQAGFICIRAKSSYVYHRDKLSFDKLGGREELFNKNETLFTRRWGRELTIGFIVRTEKELEQKKELMYRLLGMGHRIVIFARSRGRPKGLKDHLQLRYANATGFFFTPSILYKLWERLRKKHIEIVVTTDEGMRAFLGRCAFLHRAEIVDGDDEDIVRLCREKSAGERQRGEAV